VGRFRRANPDYQLGKPFVYVGMTGRDRMCALTNTRPHFQANSSCANTPALCPSCMPPTTPMPYEAAREME